MAKAATDMSEFMIVAKGVGAYPATWRRWDAAARSSGKKRQEWIRAVLDAAAEAVEKSATAKKGGK